MKELQQYTYTIPAGGSVQIPASNDNFIVQASTGPLAVRGDTFGRLSGMVAGQGLKMVPFSRLELFDESGAPNTVTLLMTPAEFVNQTFSGSVSIVGGNLTDAQLRAAPVPVRNYHEAPTGHWRQMAATVANTASAVIATAANVNGAIILTAQLADAGAGHIVLALLASAGAPANVNDAEPILMTMPTSFNSGPTLSFMGQLPHPVYVPPGQGVWFITSAAASANYLRGARYKLL